jgi:hypothetical protein
MRIGLPAIGFGALAAPTMIKAVVTKVYGQRHQSSPASTIVSLGSAQQCPEKNKGCRKAEHCANSVPASAFHQ